MSPRPIRRARRILAACSALLLTLSLTSSALAAAPVVPAWQLKWGNLGATPGQFNAPNGIASDGVGNVYVVDQVNQRVQKFDRLGNLVLQWGSYGAGNGQFYNPCGIAVDLQGNVYVVDGSNSRIQKFTASGVYVTQWGSPGSGPGQFTGLSGNCATDPAGNVYVADVHRVQKFTSAGVFVIEWGALGSADGQFNAPQSVATDAAGHVYVVDRLNSRIQKFTSSGSFVTKWGSSGTGAGEFVNHSDVATDPLGNVNVVDDMGRIQRFSPDGAFEAEWGSGGAGDGQFSGPKSLDVDRAGNIYVADTGNHRVQKYSGAALTMIEAPPRFLFGWGTPGTGNGQFSGPQGMAIDAAGNLYVADYYNSRVQKFTGTGEFVWQRGYSGATCLAIDAADNLYVNVWAGDMVHKYDSSGAYLHSLGGPGPGQLFLPDGIATDAAGNVYVAGADCKVKKYAADGTFLLEWGSCGSGNGQFNNPRGLAVDAWGHVYVVDHNNHRVQKFTSTGTYLTQWGGYGTADGQFDYPMRVAVDAAGHVYVTENNGNRVQKFTSSGTFLCKWGSSGFGDGQFTGTTGVATDAAGNVYVAAHFSNRIQKFSTAPVIALVSDVGNDQGRQARLRILRASADAAGSGSTVTGYAVYRRVEPGAMVEGASAHRAATSAAAQLAGWDYVTTIPARGDAEYAAVVPTVGDARAATRDYTTFFVSALTPAPTVYHDSAVEAGFSIDNLAPPAPTPFLAAWLGGATHLHWGVSTAADFAAFHLYRGASADFTPGSGNLVATTTDTGYVDAAATGAYYKLAAVDWNGNVSPYAVIGPGQTVAVDEHARLGLALDEIHPNPVRGAGLVARFSLPAGGQATLELLDIAGRRLEERRVSGAGRHLVKLGSDGARPGGIYLVRLTHGGVVRTRRAVVLE